MKKNVIIVFVFFCSSLLNAQNGMSAINCQKVALSVGQSIDLSSYSDLMKKFSEVQDSAVNEVIWKNLSALASTSQMSETGAKANRENVDYDVYNEWEVNLYGAMGLANLWPDLEHNEVMELLKNHALREVIYRQGIKLISGLCKILPSDFYYDVMDEIEEVGGLLELMKGHVFEEYMDVEENLILFVDGNYEWDFEEMFPGVEDAEMFFFLVRRVINNDVPVEEMISALNRLSNNLKQMNYGNSRPEYLSMVTMNDDLCLVDAMDGCKLISTKPQGEESDIENRMENSSVFDYVVTMVHDARGDGYQIRSKNGGPSFLVDRRGKVLLQY